MMLKSDLEIKHSFKLFVDRHRRHDVCRGRPRQYFFFFFPKLSLIRYCLDIINQRYSKLKQSSVLRTNIEQQL